jgi:signal transduction histidine kinase
MVPASEAADSYFAQNSSSNRHVKRPTHLNALCDEYLRLAYHGVRAKDKTFNATLTTDFAVDLPLVSVVAPDLGRVLLNLFANAFYATREHRQQEGNHYQPTIKVSAQLVENWAVMP